MSFLICAFRHLLLVAQWFLFLRNTNP